MHSHKQLLEDKETAGSVVLEIFVLLDRVFRSEIHCKTNHMPSLHVFLLDQALSMDTVFSSFSSNCSISLGETSILFFPPVLFIPCMFHHITMLLHQSIHVKPFQPERQ